MATISSTPQKKTNERTLPPKRGRIKAEIFKALMKQVSCMASKPGQPVEKNRGEGSDSASATPPPSSNSSDANSEKS